MPILVSEISPTLLRVFAFVFGAAWGSFFNVAIYRWPRDMSVVKPASRCPSCGTPIPGHLNIPIFGWLLLRGRTACCKTPLSPRYPLIELLTAILCVAVCDVFVIHADPDAELLHVSLQALCYFAFVGGLIIVTFVDLDEWIIPDEVSLPGTALGLATASFREVPGVEDCAFGAGMAFLLTQLPFVWGYEAVTGRRGLGEGDPKLLMMIGSFLGLQGALFALLAGSMQGLLFAGISLATGRGLRQPEPDSAAAEATHESPAATTPLDTVGAIHETTAAEATIHESSSPETVPPSHTASPITVGASHEAPSDTPDENDAGIGKLKLPFGPMLSLAALEYLFFSDALVGYWMGLFSAVD